MTRNEFDLMIKKEIVAANELIPNEMLPDLPPMQDYPDVPEWHDFEHAMWKIGENIRQLILKHKKELNDNQINDILSICSNPNAKRGRESFVMLLGKKRHVKYAPQLIELIDDRYIEGHVVYTIEKMGAPQYTNEITPFLSHKKTWIRNIAKKYIQKYGN